MRAHSCMQSCTFWDVQGGALTVYKTILVVSSTLEGLLDVTNLHCQNGHNVLSWKLDTVMEILHYYHSI